MSELRFKRATCVLWRQGPDRVLVRRVSGEALDLLGPAAMVWIALDVPCTLAELSNSVGDLTADPSGVGVAVRELLDHGVLEQSA